MYPARANLLGNEYCQLLAEHLEQQGARVREYSRWSLLLADYDVLHLHWPDWFGAGRTSRRRFLSLLHGLLVVAAVVVRRKKVVWTVHNLESHDWRSPRVARYVNKSLGRWGSGTIHLSRASLEQMTSTRHPARHLPARVIQHGTYPVTDSDAAVQHRFRQSVELPRDTKVLVFVGRLEPYKGVLELLEVFRALDDPRVRLLIAGRAGTPQIATDIQRAAQRDKRVVLHMQHLTSEELVSAIRLGELVCLPYTRVHNSGSVLHVLSAGRAVLVPDLPVFRELQDLVGAAWVRTYHDLTPAVLRQALYATAGTGAPDLTRFAWASIADATMRFYQEVLHRPN